MAEEKDNNNTFGSFNNKYVRGGAAALIAAYVAKEDPYLLEGFAESLAEKDKADRESRNAIIKAALETKLQLKAKDEERRSKETRKVTPKLNEAKQVGLSSAVASKAYKAGELDLLIQLKRESPDYNVEKMYNIAEPYRDKIKNMTHEQFIQSLVGKSKQYKNLTQDITSKITNPLRKFVQGTDTDTSLTSDINQKFSAMDVKEDDSDFVDVDYSKIEKTAEGKRVLAALMNKDEKTKAQTVNYLKEFTSNRMGIKLKYDPVTRENVFTSDDIKNVNIANLVTKHFVDEVDSLIKDPNSPAFRNKEVALSLINNKYLEYDDVTGLRKLSFDKINEQYDNPIIPEGWTPSTPDKKQIAAAKKAKEKIDGDDKNVNKGKGKKTTQERINELIEKYEKKKRDLLKEYNGNTNNSSYQNKLRIAGNKIRNNIKDLGGTGSEIPYATKEKKDN